MELPLVSVIIPVFNAEDTIRRCVQSVMSQDYPNIEIILIDDGSEDGSGAICGELEKNNNHIICIHSENQGVAHARNLGLRKYHGEFCCFVDADDEIDSRFVGILMEAVLYYSVPLVTCLFSNGLPQFDVSYVKWGDYADLLSIDAYDLFADYAHSTVCGALYARDLLNGLWFDESLAMGEDTLFFMQVLLKCRTLVHVALPLYNYYQNEASLTHSRYSSKNRASIRAWTKICRLSECEDGKMRTMCHLRLAGCCKRNFRRMIQDGFTDKGDRANIIRILRSEARSILHSPMSGMKKAEYLLLMYLPGIYAGLYKCFIKIKRGR
jgi:glycosyltransferase involved in cell wall biosynthesis